MKLPKAWLFTKSYFAVRAGCLRLTSSTTSFDKQRTIDNFTKNLSIKDTCKISTPYTVGPLWDSYWIMREG